MNDHHESSALPVEEHPKDDNVIVEGEDKSLNLPFDLNNLFNLSFTFDTLKIAIEYLARQQNNTDETLKSLIEKTNVVPVEVVSDFDEPVTPMPESIRAVSEMKNKRASVTSMMSVSVARLNKHDPFLEDLKSRIELLENRAQANEDKIDASKYIKFFNFLFNLDHEKTIENEGNLLGAKSTLAKHGDRITALEDNLKLLERMGRPASEDGGSGLMESLNDLEKRMKDWTEENYAPKVSTNQRLEDLENALKALTDRVDGHDKNIDSLQTGQDTLFKKVADNVKAMDDMKWFFNKNSNMFGEGLKS
jgi:chaperonin cofactor prefoldin